MTTKLLNWATPRLSKLLPLDEDSLKQIITYADTLPKDAAAEHLKNLLGDSSQAFEFVSSFNSYRQPPPASNAPPPVSSTRSATSEVPRSQPRRGPKKKPNIHELPARQIEDRGDASGGYVKRGETDYMPSRARGQGQGPRSKEPPLANVLQLNEKPDAIQIPSTSNTASGSSSSSSKLPPSAAGSLISDSLAPPSKSAKGSRSTSPAQQPQKMKITMVGGKAMHGASTALSDLDSAIRSLEITTNPSLSDASPEDLARRRCNCMATRHPLLTMAPNCTKCGKIICVKEGLGPCTFCSTPLLNANEIQSVLRVLKDERGKERQTTHNASHKRAEVSAKPRAFTGRDFLSSASSSRGPSPLASTTASATASANVSEAEHETEDDDEMDEGLRKAKAHRDRLLTFQTNNAKRTRIHDEAADYDVPVAGTNMWASPAERAMQLKKQQKIMREMEWNARPDYEKRTMVASIDIVDGKAVRKMVPAERPAEPVDDDDGAMEESAAVERNSGNKNSGGGAFSQNPLLGALIRPVARAEKGKDAATEGGREKSVWRRVQDDRDDNEGIILDGGAYGGRVEGRVLGAEERAVAATAG